MKDLSEINIYDPSNSDVLSWMESAAGPTNWMDEDWDFYVCNGKNDDLILANANNAECRQREFFLHCLYHLVADYRLWNSSNKTLFSRINKLLGCVDDGYLESVKKWKKETNDLFADSLVFDKYYWLDHLTFVSNSSSSER